MKKTTNISIPILISILGLQIKKIQMKRLIGTVAICICAILPSSIFAQGEDTSFVEFELGFVSNYVFRGFDYFEDRAGQEDKVPGAHTGAWAFQPSLTFSPQEQGFYFNIWGSFALTDRADKSATDASPPPGNGLRRADEVDYTLGYQRETRIGTVGFGTTQYTYIDYRRKATVFGGRSDNEIFFNYSPPGIGFDGLYFNIYSSVPYNAEYYQFGYNYILDLEEDVSLSFDLAAGYGVQPGIDGWQDFTGSIGIDFFGVSFYFNTSVRGASEFFDFDGNLSDFKVADPVTMEDVHLSKTLWWLYLAYTIEV